jgi:hypothetical protein
LNARFKHSFTFSNSSWCPVAFAFSILRTDALILKYLIPFFREFRNQHLMQWWTVHNSYSVLYLMLIHNRSLMLCEMLKYTDDINMKISKSVYITECPSIIMDKWTQWNPHIPCVPVDSQWGQFPAFKQFPNLDSKFSVVSVTVAKHVSSSCGHSQVTQLPLTLVFDGFW